MHTFCGLVKNNLTCYFLCLCKKSFFFIYGCDIITQKRSYKHSKWIYYNTCSNPNHCYVVTILTMACYLSDCPALYCKAERGTVATYNICTVFVEKPILLEERQSVMRNKRQNRNLTFRFFRIHERAFVHT